MRTRLYALVTSLLLVAAATAIAAEATVVPGDRIRGRLGDGGSDTLRFVVGAPASLQVKTKLGGDLRVALSLHGPDGDQVVTAHALRNPTSSKPALKGVELRQVGTYRLVVSRTEGTGDYSVKLALKSPRPRDIDLSGAPKAEETMTIDADQVVFSPGGTGLDAGNVQEAVEETVELVQDAVDALEQALDARLEEAEEHLAELDGVVAALDDSTSTLLDTVDTTVTEVDTALADFESQVSALDDRVDTFDGGGDLLRVLWALDTTQSVTSTSTFSQGYNRDVERITRHRIVQLDFDPGEVQQLVEVIVKWSSTPTFLSTQESGVTPNAMVYGEMPGKLILSSVDQLLYYVQPDARSTLWGLTIPTPSDPNFRDNHLARFVYRPTASEVQNGFTLDVYFGAFVYEEPVQGVVVDDLTIDIHTAIVRGR